MEEDNFNRIRNQRNRAGDTGREGKLEKYEIVRKADDESIDDSASEVGWNSEDEHNIKLPSRRKSALKSRKKSKQRKSSMVDRDEYPEEELDAEEPSDQDEAGDGEMLLSDMLLSNLNSFKSADRSKKHADKGSSAKAKKANASRVKVTAPDSDDERDGSDDDDIMENAAETSESGMDGEETDSDGDSHPTDHTDDDDDDDDYDDDDEDDDLDQMHSRLLTAIDRFSKAPSATASNALAAAAAKSRKTSQSAPESSLSLASQIEGSGGELSMNALLGALDDSQQKQRGGLAVVRKHLAELERGLSAPKHVEKVTAERAERDQTYESSRSDMSKWQDVVTTNRHVRTLDLAQDKRELPSARALVNRFVPTTDMEKEIQMVLVKHDNASDRDAMEKEEDELQAKNVSMQEIRERQAELAKVKALMFYEQMKRHRLNKIKSKAYRKIQKKKKFRLEQKRMAAAGDDGDNEGDGSDFDGEAAERAEKSAYKRVKERMDLRHKNTSKWAKMALRHGHADKNLRDAYHEAVQLGQDLSKKMTEEQEVPASAEADSDAEEVLSGSDEDATAGNGAAVSSRAARALKRMLAEQENNTAQASSVVTQGKYKKLFEMDFMRKAAEQQREHAREEAKELLREIENMEHDSADSAHGSDLDSHPQQHGKKKNNKKITEDSLELQEQKAMQLKQAKKDVWEMFGSSSGGREHGSMVIGQSIKRGRRGMVLDADLPESTTNLNATNLTANTASAGWSMDDDGSAMSKSNGHHDNEDADNTDNPWLQQPAAAATAAMYGRDLDPMRNSNSFSTLAQQQHSSSEPSSSGLRMVSTTASSKLENKVFINVVGSGNSQQQGGTVTPSMHMLAQIDKSLPAIEDSNAAPPSKSSKRKKRSAADAAATTAAAATGLEDNDDAQITATVASDGEGAADSKTRKESLTTQKSQSELVSLAFSGPDYEEEFRQHKQQAVDDELGIKAKEMEIVDQVKAGWGDWAGPGAMKISNKILNKRQRLLTGLQKDAEDKRAKRGDAKKMNVIISQKRIKTAAKFKIAAVPHPFATREEYERTLQVPIGDEWNSSVVVKQNVQPDVKIRPGRVIEPIKLAKKRSAAEGSAGTGTSGSKKGPMKSASYSNNGNSKKSRKT